MGARNSNTFGFISHISKIAMLLCVITVMQHVLRFVSCVPWSSDHLSLNIQICRNIAPESNHTKVRFWFFMFLCLSVCTAAWVCTAARDKTWATFVWLWVLGVGLTLHLFCALFNNVHPHPWQSSAASIFRLSHPALDLNVYISLLIFAIAVYAQAGGCTSCIVSCLVCYGACVRGWAHQ